MLQIPGDAFQNCTGVTRRQLLQIGSPILGLGLADLLRNDARAAKAGKATAPHVTFVHHVWDSKSQLLKLQVGIRPAQSSNPVYLITPSTVFLKAELSSYRMGIATEESGFVLDMRYSASAFRKKGEFKQYPSIMLTRLDPNLPYDLIYVFQFPLECDPEWSAIRSFPTPIGKKSVRLKIGWSDKPVESLPFPTLAEKDVPSLFDRWQRCVETRPITIDFSKI